MIDELSSSVTYIVEQTKLNLPILTYILAILWGILILDKILQHRLLYLGIFPRRIEGIPGILFAPLLHANANHLFFNSIPLVVLSDFLLINGLTYYLDVTLIITLISGGLVWCFAKPGLHVGASGVITGYWALLVCNIYQQGTVTAIILGIICVYYFAGIFLGVFPQKKGISWEGHLFGLIAGVIATKLPIIT